MAKGKMVAFFVGGVIGAGAALLFAPRSGSETRALLTDKAEELWGEGSNLYSQGFEKVKAEAANVQSTAAQANDELREKIENARSAIAEQVAKNAQNAREAINSQVPVAGEKISQAVDVVKGQINSAASRLKGTATDSGTDEDLESADEETTDADGETTDTENGAAAKADSGL